MKTATHELTTFNPYGLVILDLGLPGLDGLEACRRIRAARSRQSV